MNAIRTLTGTTQLVWAVVSNPGTLLPHNADIPTPKLLETMILGHLYCHIAKLLSIQAPASQRDHLALKQNIRTAKILVQLHQPPESETSSKKEFTSWLPKSCIGL